MAESSRSIGRFWSSAKSNLRNFWESLEPEEGRSPPVSGAAGGTLPSPMAPVDAADAWGDATLGAGRAASRDVFAIDEDDDDYDAPAVSDASLADAEEQLESMGLESVELEPAVEHMDDVQLEPTGEHNVQPEDATEAEEGQAGAAKPADAEASEE
jgi:hypothetical protein